MGASHALVELIEDEKRGEVRISIQDDGHGFDPDRELKGFGQRMTSRGYAQMKRPLSLCSRKIGVCDLQRKSREP